MCTLKILNNLITSLFWAPVTGDNLIPCLGHDRNVNMQSENGDGNFTSFCC